MGFVQDSSWTAFGSQKLVEHFFLNTPYTPPASLWLALGTGTTTLVGEPSGNNYARLEFRGSTGLAFSAPLTDDKLGAVSNPAPWAFNQAQGGNWGTMQQICVMDAATAGNQLNYARITGTAINDQAQFQIGVGDLEFRNRVDPTQPSNITGTGPGHAKFVNLMLRGGQAAADTNFFMGLLDADLSASSTDDLLAGIYTSEVSNGGYARVEVGEDTPASGVGATRDGARLEIDADVDFPTITANYTNPVFWVGIFDLVTAGTMLGVGRIRDGGNSSGFVTAPGITGGKNSFFRLDDSAGFYGWQIL